MTRRYWWGEIGKDGTCTPAPVDGAAALARLATLETPMESWVPAPWEATAACGGFADRAEYLARLHRLAARLAAAGVADALQRPDIELARMVRALDGLDEAINLLTERAVEWHATRDPGFTRKFSSMPARRLVPLLAVRAKGPLRALLAEIEALAASRAALAKDVTRAANRVLPNCSALVGGLVAARLLAAAGSLDALARLPGSGIQVLGARTALFSHIRSGTPPPKHGLVFQHRRVHNAPPGRRGRVARVLASRLAIAARIDRFRGEADAVFIEVANARIDGVLE
ncbi:MAG: RNA-processing protein [Methanospirillum sp.]|nr:RNA-processing protein [Methanospirillum sp.]